MLIGALNPMSNFALINGILGLKKRFYSIRAWRFLHWTWNKSLVIFCQNYFSLLDLSFCCCNKWQKKAFRLSLFHHCLQSSVPALLSLSLSSSITWLGGAKSSSKLISFISNSFSSVFVVKSEKSKSQTFSHLIGVAWMTFVLDVDVMSPTCVVDVENIARPKVGVLLVIKTLLKLILKYFTTVQQIQNWLSFAPLATCKLTEICDYLVLQVK